MNRMRFALSLLTVAFVLVGLAHDARAVGGEWDKNEHVEMRLVSAVQAVGKHEALPLGLQFRMKPGWKLYWRSPGDAGFPPRPIWGGSENINDVRVDWPAPTRFSIFDLETLGYSDEVILPLTARVERPGTATTIHAKVDYLTCKDICIPYQASAKLHLPAGDALASPHAHLLDQFRARVPGDGNRHGLAISGVQLASIGEQVKVTVVATAREPFVAPDIFVEGPEGSFFGKPEVSLSDGGRRAIVAVSGGGFEKPVSAEGVPLVLTLVDGDRMLEETTTGKPDALKSIPMARAADETSVWFILLLALAGGLILNLMPCVLPVLSLKLLSVVGHGGQDPQDVRRGFIASAAGIIFSFLLIATALVALQSAGVAIGWGIQFQQPVFLVAMTLIVALFASNLFGFFEIVLPGALSNIAGSAGDSHSLGGHFLTGAFATLLATPCSAPFLGTAVGFALSRGAVEIFGIFLVLGLGLSLPYLCVAAVPQLATRLPRPGNWMIWLRRILALALAATGVWLITVLAAQIGPEAAVGVAALVVLMVAVIALKKLPNSRLGRHAGKVTAALAVAALLAGTVAPPTEPTTSVTSTAWRPFDQDALRRFVASGKTVFVDVTADWCLTCQVNKKLVLDTAPVAPWLDRDDVIPMRADWTRPDPAISAYLASFGRYGIPFNAVYGPKAPDGIALPELLTSDIVVETAARADGGATVAQR